MNLLIEKNKILGKKKKKKKNINSILKRKEKYKSKKNIEISFDESDNEVSNKESLHT